MEELLKQLAEQLGTTVEYLWQVMVNQAHVFIIIYTTRLIFTTLLFLPLTWILKKFLYWLDEDDDSWQCTLSFIFGLIMVIAIIFSVIILIADFDNFITAIYNPEYWALQEVLKHISR